LWISTWHIKYYIKFIFCLVWFALSRKFPISFIACVTLEVFTEVTS
jgi:hypothetical protein